MIPALLAQMTLTGALGRFDEAIATFVENYRYQFVPMGMTLYHAFAAIVIVWAGVQIALSGDAPDMGRVMKLVLVLAFGSAMVRNFAGGDWSIPYLIEAQVRLMCRQFESHALEQIAIVAVQQQQAAAQSLGPLAGITNMSAAISYAIVTLIWALLEAVAWFVTSFGTIACAICVVLGPVFVPFFIVPKLDWLFWGWLRAYMQFAFYKLIATMVIGIVADGLMRGSSVPPLQATFFHFLPYGMLAMAGIGVLLKVPALTSHIFSGSAGSDGSLLSMARGAVSTAVSGAGGGMVG
ncbi:MAG: type IV secretion system protein, partial [Planctomycetes bacterium]|nr:type IV secretion system protein [Planctomycetota bacterium]